MSGVMGKFLVSGIVLSSIVACSSSSDSSKYKVPAAKVDACDFRLTDGGIADYSALNQRNIVQAYFGKEYNASYLAAVAAANAESTMDFANQTGTTIYKAEPRPRNVCGFSLFTTATSLPLDLEAKWKTATSDDGPKTGYTVGLYLPKSNTNKLPSVNNGAAIIVRENADRWTLVHEFMHHLFMLRSVENGHNDDVMKDSIGASADEMDAIDKNTEIKDDSQKYLLKMPAFIKLANGIDALMIHYSLEEVTIEATLKDAVQAGSLKYVPTDGDNWYIYSSSSRAYSYYLSIEKEAKDFQAGLPATAFSEQASIRDILSMVERRKSAILDMVVRYPYDEPKGGAKITHAQHDHSPCPHEAEVQGILDRADGVLNRH